MKDFNGYDEELPIDTPKTLTPHRALHKTKNFRLDKEEVNVLNEHKEVWDTNKDDDVLELLKDEHIEREESKKINKWCNLL